ncbi:MAG: ABC transporter substrate-binding protein [Microbacterium sp.]
MRKLALASAAVITLLLTGCGSGGTTVDDSDAPRTLRLAATIANNSFDTAQLQTGNLVQYWQPVYDTLLVLDTDAQLQPNLATEWSYDETNTALSLTLRDDVTFTDGTAFDADAVKANLEHFAQGSGSNASMLAAVSDVEVVDDTHVVITLSQPDPGLTNYLSTVAGAMASPAALGDDSIATEPAGSGPYVLDADESVAGATYVYERNEDYWNPDAFPYDTVTITVMEETTARLNALRSGEIDGALADQKSAAEAESAGLTLNVHRLDWQGLIIADRDGSTVEALGDPLVRQALNYALDRDLYVENVLEGRGVASTQVFNEQSAAFVAELDESYSYDPEKAKQLLAEAGYADGFTVQMPQMSAFATLNDIVEQELADIGITVEWAKVVTEDYIPTVQTGEYGMFIMQLSSGNEWRDIYKSISPEGPWNPLASSDADTESLIAAAAAATNEEEYTGLLQELNEHIVEQAWFAPIAFVDTIYVTADGVSVTPQPQNVVPSIRNYQ